MLPKTVLVTGGAGYIGSHTVLELLLGSFKIVVVDNLDNSSEVAIHRVKELVGKFGNILSFHKVDLRDKAGLEPIFVSTKFDVAIHFVGLKAVGESLQKPLLYYDNNLIGTITILEVVAAHGCKKSSSTIMPKSWGKGEYLCIRRELREIPISHYRSNQEEALLYAASVKRRSRNLSYVKRCSGSRDRHEQHISTAFV